MLKKGIRAGFTEKILLEQWLKGGEGVNHLGEQHFRQKDKPGRRPVWEHTWKWLSLDQRAHEGEEEKNKSGRGLKLGPFSCFHFFLIVCLVLNENVSDLSHIILGPFVFVRRQFRLWVRYSAGIRDTKITIICPLEIYLGFQRFIIG